MSFQNFNSQDRFVALLASNRSEAVDQLIEEVIGLFHYIKFLESKDIIAADITECLNLVASGSTTEISRISLYHTAHNVKIKLILTFFFENNNYCVSMSSDYEDFNKDLENRNFSVDKRMYIGPQLIGFMKIEPMQEKNSMRGPYILLFILLVIILILFSIFFI